MNALTGSPGDRRARHRTGRADRFGRRADPALPRRARRAAAVDAGRRHRQDRRRRAQGDPARLRRRGARQRRSCRCCWPPPSPIRCAGCRRRRSGCGAASRAARKSRISPTARTRSAICRSRVRDMTNALYDRIEAIESFAADVVARAEEPADLAAQRGRDPAARQEREFAQAADGDHPARRAPARPADHRHFRRLAPRCRTGARGCRHGRPEEVHRRSRRRVARGRRATRRRSRSSSRSPSCRRASRAISSSATTCASARSSPT